MVRNGGFSFGYDGRCVVCIGSGGLQMSNCYDRRRGRNQMYDDLSYFDYSHNLIVSH